MHAQQAAQAREQLEEVRQKALDGIRSSGLSTEQLRELELLRERVVLAEQDVSAKNAELLRWTSGAAARSGAPGEAWDVFTPQLPRHRSWDGDLHLCQGDHLLASLFAFEYMYGGRWLCGVFQDPERHWLQQAMVTHWSSCGFSSGM